MNRSTTGSGAQKSGDAPIQHTLKRLVTTAAAALLLVAIFIPAGNLLHTTSVDPVQEQSYYRLGFIDGYTTGRKLAFSRKQGVWRAAIRIRPAVQKAGPAVNRKSAPSLSVRRT